jgi:predicted helicase
VSALLSAAKPEHVRVQKMKFAKTCDPKTNKSINNKTKVFDNAHITLRDIPEEAYSYIVNGKPTLDWAMERQGIKEDPDSGLVNDANLWAAETMNLSIPSNCSSASSP